MNLKKIDKEFFDLIQKEEKQQLECLMMIPSENRCSLGVLEALGSCFTNKYAEGYPGKRYYQGVLNSDKLENLVIERAKKLFKVPYANVQPYSGSVANLEIYFSILKPGDKILSLGLNDGGHLTHGSSVSLSSKFFKISHYMLNPDGVLDYTEIERIALKEKPQLIISGFSAYPRIINWKKFSEIAKKVNCLFMADISHVAGLIVGGEYPSCANYADIIMTTTHKTLRGPRGAMIMVTKKGLKFDPELGDKISKSVFPGMQGGPHLNNIAAIGVCLKEASLDSFKKYIKQVILNSKCLSLELKKYGFNLVSGGTDTHLILIDLRNLGIDGKEFASVLESVGIICNKNMVPLDTGNANTPSGIRLGTPFLTSRGMKEKEMKEIALIIKEVLEDASNKEVLKKLKLKVLNISKKF